MSDHCPTSQNEIHRINPLSASSEADRTLLRSAQESQINTFGDKHSKEPPCLDAKCSTNLNRIDKKQCLECEKPCTKRCRQCRSVYYCSRKCQRTDWPIHRHVCNVTPLPKDELMKIYSNYGCGGSKRVSDENKERGRSALIQLVYFYRIMDDPSILECEVFGIHLASIGKPCLHQDVLLVKFLLRCMRQWVRPIPMAFYKRSTSEPYSISKFHPEIVNMLKKADIPCLAFCDDVFLSEGSVSDYHLLERDRLHYCDAGFPALVALCVHVDKNEAAICRFSEHVQELVKMGCDPLARYNGPIAGRKGHDALQTLSKFGKSEIVPAFQSAVRLGMQMRATVVASVLDCHGFILDLSKIISSYEYVDHLETIYPPLPRDTLFDLHTD
jgi:hypothetical protein